MGKYGWYATGLLKLEFVVVYILFIKLFASVDIPA